ncbi:epoxyqueuosine reductase [Fulvitalea axinellae]|uniref:Epoxyqueuosine reductase n=1 Tax=Fulvitalea axinellae TaxID=1182444 RepID=A0AAU9DIN4_9BACT|nr:epoxyqueuosine reductase [Fulvitalea axinellae]
MKNHSEFIKRKATELGFAFCGISKAGYLEDEARHLENWLNQGMNGQMGYMANHFDKRVDPTKLVEGAKSVVSLAYNYYPEQDLAQDGNYKIAKYAYGKDYHFTLKAKLRQLMDAIQEEVGAVEGRAFVDSAPVLEHAWAQRAGLGWVGKHSLLLNRQMGSFFFLSELIIDLELEPDGPVKDYCGTCTKCIDACPTDAIVAPKTVDGSRCISYLTIELKDEIPSEFAGKTENWMFGCDICQDVCPWNRFSKPHNEPDFMPHEDLGKLNKKDWEEITRDVFNEIFRKSAVKRTKLEGLTRNINFIKGNSTKK